MLTMGLKKIKMNFAFSSIRKMLRMYRESANIDLKYKPDKYLNKNLLKNKI